MTRNQDIAEGIAAALEPLAAAIPDLQITPHLNTNPTPPSIDVFPADPFQDPEGFDQSKKLYWVVRARASTVDQEAGQDVLLQLLEPEGPTSVEEALCWDGLGGVVGSVTLASESPSGYRFYQELSTTGEGVLIGCEWRLEVMT